MIVDVNANMERWPFRRTPCDELPRLVDRMRRHGVGQAWVGNLDGIFHRDVGGVNIRLSEACRGQRDPALIPFGTVNPKLPDWREDLRRCHEQFHMPGIRIHPNFHGYKLDDPMFAELLDASQQRGLIVQLVIRMDDVRLQHPLIDVPEVDVSPLTKLIRERPELRFVVLNGADKIRSKAMGELASTTGVYFDIATQEIVGGVASFASAITPQRVLFGSHVPLFPLEASVLKMRESGLGEDTRALIESKNALRILGY
ncbi:MAG TPA: amidohydrolase family protein [Verrucomicrobiae bacterium]|nr:amidohydrolase family protein [Verrucomicrobiae bacterium]